MVDSGIGRRYDTDNRVRAALQDAAMSAMRQAHTGRNEDRHSGVPARSTEADRQFLRDVWGTFFKAKKWKELYEMATTYPVIEDAAEEIYGSLAYRRIREKIEARQDYERRQRMIESMIADLKEQIADKDAELAEERVRTADKDAKLADKDAEIADKDAELADKDAEIAELKRLLGMA